MKLIFALMLLLETAACVERSCSFYQSDPCSAALGDKLSLTLLMSQDASEHDLRIQKIINNNDPVCKIKKGSIRTGECDLYKNRSEVSFVNGILIINSVIRADSGNYRLEVFNSNGTRISSEDLQVIVEDPLVLPLVLGCLAVILIVLIIVAFYFYKKRNRLKLTTNVSECVNEPVTQKKQEQQTSPDVEYATINSQSKNKRKRKRKEDEVQYGEVTFSSSSAHKPRHTQEDCVYADVQMR